MTYNCYCSLEFQKGQHFAKCQNWTQIHIKGIYLLSQIFVKAEWDEEKYVAVCYVSPHTYTETISPTVSIPMLGMDSEITLSYEGVEITLRI